MKVIKLSNISDIGTIINMSHRVLLLVDAKWLMKSISIELQRKLLYKYLSYEYEIDTLYLLISEGNDDLEDFVINVINSKSVPVLVGINNNNIDMIYELNNIIEDSNNYYKGLTLKMQNFKAGMSIEGNKDIIQSLFTNAIYDIPMIENLMTIGKIFISGDRSSVGKSTTCLALLSSLLKLGVKPQDLAYIKPVTQCEALQPVTEFCQRNAIANRAIGPVVFYKGFTRAFLAGETESVENLLYSISQAVEEISQGKKLTIIDGVGYPSVGSICSISNADVAKYLNAPVLLIGKSGVGDAVDSYNLNSRYFEAIGVTVLGGIFNKFQIDGFYSLESCKESITQYFRLYRSNHKAYGFMPMVEKDENSNNDDEILTSVFMNHVNIKEIVLDIWNYNLNTQVVDEIESERLPHPLYKNPMVRAPTKEEVKLVTPINSPIKHSKVNTTAARIQKSESLPQKRSREEIENIALQQGAKGG